MDTDVEISLLDDDPEHSNPQTDRNSDDAAMFEGNNEPASIVPCQDETPEDQESGDEMAEITKTKLPKGRIQFDKFKRRLIRVIARYLRNNQAPTDATWEELKKRTGCDCKLLWDRMRALAIKKLRRLFSSDDTVQNIAQIAQLNVTDWLMVDLVLVHENLDVIGQDLEDADDKESPRILEDLFATVVIYNLENLEGDVLTKAWFEATRDYNGTERQCSPMLLQRRWYQMKLRVREKFYQFWFSYRGDQRQLAAANEFKPTTLELEIVKHFKYITTKPFATWEELIEQKKVALPEDFERLQLAKRRIFRTETGPDLEVIEPHVETIDLEQDTDSEESRDTAVASELKENVNLAIVKIEKTDETEQKSDEENDVHVLESVHIRLETDKNAEVKSDIRDNNEIILEDEIFTDINNEEDIDIDISSQQNTDEESEDVAEVVMPRILASTSTANISSFDIVMPKITNVSSAAILNEEPAKDAVNNEINGILESVAENISSKKLFKVLPSPLNTDKSLPTPDKIGNLNTLVKNIKDTIENQNIINITENQNTALNAQITGSTKQGHADKKPENDAEIVMPAIVASTSMANISNDFDIVMPKITNVSSAAILTEEPVNYAVNNEINSILESVAENISTKKFFNVLPSSLNTDKSLAASDNMEDFNTLVKNIIDTKVKKEIINTTETKNIALNAQITRSTKQRHTDKKPQNDAKIVMPAIVASTSMANISNDFDEVMPKITNVSSAASLTEEPVNYAVNNEINSILESVAENISTKKFFNVLPSPLNTDKSLSAPDNMKDLNTLVKNIIDTTVKKKIIITTENQNIASNAHITGFAKQLTTDKEPQDDAEIVMPTIVTSMSKRETEVRVNREEHVKKFNPINDMPVDINIFDGIELEDDGIEYIEEYDDVKEYQPIAIKTEQTDDSDCSNTPTIDLKLLLTPLVYTKKLDDMDVFRFIDYYAVKDKRVIENADNESKPVDRNSVKMEEISQERQPTPDSDAFSDSASEYHSEVDFGRETISSSSWLLNKLPKLSYNPIQLCKNPDFNTRLKRLSAGFFSSERNRYLLKECKPLTVDLHKSFESKLHNNTLYLSGTKSIDSKVDIKEEVAIGKAVLPTAETVENLINNVVNDILGPAPPSDSSKAQFLTQPILQDSYPVERKKVINLPDIAQIRRLNETLLTAEVTPIQVSLTKPPVNIVNIPSNLQNNDTLQNTTTNIINKGTDSTTSSTFLPEKNRTASIISTVNVTSDSPSGITQSKASNISAGIVKNSGDVSNINSKPFNDDLTSTTNKTNSESLNRRNKVSKGSLINRFNSLQQKKINEPKKGVRVNRVEVSWNPKPKKFVVPRDILLTSDTVDKILNICRGEAPVVVKNTKQRSKYDKALRKKALRQDAKEEPESTKKTNQSKNEVSEGLNDTDVSFVSKSPIENLSKDTDHNYTKKNELEENETKKRKIEIFEKRMVKLGIKRNKYCCWAREKIFKLDAKKRSVKRHDCPRPLCNCCCRQELVDKMLELRSENNKTSQMEKKTTTKPIKITVTSAQYPCKSDTEVPQTTYDTPSEIPQKTSKSLSRKVSVGINTDFDMDFENGFAANLAELNSSSKFFNNEINSASSIEVTYAPNINQAYGQTQTSVNLSVLDKNNKTVSDLKFNSDNSKSNFSFKENNSSKIIPKKNIIVINKKNPTLKEMNSSIEPKKNTMDSSKNNPHFSFNQRKSSRVISKISIVSHKNNPILSYSESNSRNVTKKRILVSDKNNTTDKFDDHNLDSNDLNFNTYPKIASKPLTPGSAIAPLNCDDSGVELQEQGGKSDKILFLSNDKMNNAYSRTPICLGKNKILLCSFEKSHVNNQSKVNDISNDTDSSQNTSQQVALPDGVRVVLLPNKELALSIDPGVQLDPGQLAYLPTLMMSIQRQLADTDLVDNIANPHIDPLQNQGDSNDQNITLNDCNEFEVKLDDKKQNANGNLNDGIQLSCSEQLIDIADDNVEAVSNKNTEVGYGNKEVDNCVLKNSNECVVDLQDNSDSNKKTILSDLMEMSGISAEDTNITNNASPTKQKSELYPTLIPEGLQAQIINKHNVNLMNNPLFKVPVVQAALSRCPELCIIFSYQELRYASENNAQFFKMDIETGVIVPINLIIKRHLGTNQQNAFTISKSVIDLTDDLDEDRTIDIEEQNSKPGEEKTKDRAVPVKLFSSIHPSILRRGKSLLVQSITSNDKPNPRSIIKKKNMIRVIQVKHKRKQPMECVESIDLDSDTEQKEDTTVSPSSEATPEKTISDDDCESDDEPLALKAKRMKNSVQPNESPEALNQITEQDNQVEKLVDNNQITEMDIDSKNKVTEPVDETPTGNDAPKNITDEGSVNSTPHLEPVVYEPLSFGENVPESSDEDCILGV